MREAILHLGDDQLAAVGLDDIVGAARSAGLREATELVCHGPGGVILLRVAEPLPEADLDGFESVEWWERLAASPSGVTYLCKVVAPELPEEFAIDEHAVDHDIDAVHEEGFDLSVVGTQDDIGRSVAATDEAGMDVALRRLGEYRGPSAALDSLTDRQREAVETAFAMGYYEVPREASVAEVAAELGLDDSTVAEHLQRAERNLLAGVLDEGV